jgi:hypothetical protein
MIHTGTQEEFLKIILIVAKRVKSSKTMSAAASPCQQKWDFPESRSIPRIQAAWR